MGGQIVKKALKSVNNEGIMQEGMNGMADELQGKFEDKKAQEMQEPMLAILNAIAEEKENEVVPLELKYGGDKSLTIQVKKHIPMDQFYAFCGFLSYSCFAPDGKNVVYLPNVELTNLYLYTVKFYTDMMLPDDAQEAFNLITALNLYSKVKEILKDTDQYNAILEIEKRHSQYNRLNFVVFNTLTQTLGSVNIEETLKAAVSNTATDAGTKAK